MMLLEHEKNALNWESANRIHLSFELANKNKGLMMMVLLEFILEAQRADLNTHKASSKHIYNTNDNLNDFGT
jgi:hypothetical protein